MQEIIAEARHAYKSADGELRPIWIYLRAPNESIEGGSWECHCHIEGLLDKENRVCGEGSMQAMCLAIFYLRVNLRFYEAQGGTYYFDGDPALPTKAEDLLGDNVAMPKVWKCEETRRRD
jgi:hypothetical protein